MAGIGVTHLRPSIFQIQDGSAFLTVPECRHFFGKECPKFGFSPKVQVPDIFVERPVGNRDNDMPSRPAYPEEFAQGFSRPFEVL